MVAGNIADLAFAKQTAKGAVAAAGVHRIYLAGGGLRPLRDSADLEETSSGRLRNEAYLKQVRAEGSPEAYVRPDMIAAILYGAMGTIVTTGVADPYTHTLTLAATHPWFTFWRMLTTLNERFADCKIGEVTLAGQAGQPLRITFQVLGLSPAYKTAAETTEEVEVTDTIMHYDGSGALMVEGVAVSSIESFTLKIGAGLAVQQGDSQTPYDVTEGMREVTLDTVQTIQDWALYNRLHYGSATPADLAAPVKNVLELGGSPAGIQFTWTRVAAAPGPERSLRVSLPRVTLATFSGDEPNTSGEPLKQTVNYRAYQPSGAVSGVTAVVKNGRSSALVA